LVAFYGLALVMIGALVILKAIVPRRDVFHQPGPRLEPTAEPRLFAEIRKVAAATGQEMPPGRPRRAAAPGRDRPRVRPLPRGDVGIGRCLYQREALGRTLEPS
jgi:hypothetical protein